ncbi:saccharopine dehydrogenase (NAD+, L-lysine forming) [Tupanvirus soda lake]|uniref:Saccharopine dehydrogenase (NAD+, L-lysine forming) n=2 Tax=Tupanvirus TaxID=2094720 RepID=A0A6N1NU22_9VIRU|nr:saccharopine dehydrogenase (NAD+, L-lysine forming) [Tupanvirus soda lake]QKU35066.1 saccharopine dehydrogenase (NAD+, L-lysine forming) [Tupanvirus soda lake]
MNNIHLWLRCETKQDEYRTPITPATAKKLIDLDCRITVEKSSQRCYREYDYANVGCDLVEPTSWIYAPKNVFVVGLKELPENLEKVEHMHIYFAHCFKNQKKSKELIQKFIKGGGKILDIEYLTDENGNRLAAFGKSAGIAGALLSIMVWTEQKLTNKNAHLGKIIPVKHTSDIVRMLVRKLNKIEENPKILIIGSKGRVGKGAVDIINELGLTATEWTRNDTLNKNISNEIMQYNILINCINLDKKIIPFLTKDTLNYNDRKLSVCVDISCDYANPNNPLPIYNTPSSFEYPVINLITEHPILDVVAIENLPSLLPIDSSDDFSEQLYQCLIKLESWHDIWQRTEKVFLDQSI